jgi:hypothetical protein
MYLGVQRGSSGSEEALSVIQVDRNAEVLEVFNSLAGGFLERLSDGRGMNT